MSASIVKCPRCGSLNEAGEVACYNCGQELPAAAAAQPKAKPKPAPGRLVRAPVPPSPKPKPAPADEAAGTPAQAAAAEPLDMDEAPKSARTTRGAPAVKRTVPPGTQNVGVLGFSSSGKTVYLSMLYYATAEERHFPEAWHVDWVSEDDGATARYLRRLCRMILGLNDAGYRRYDDSKTRVQRAFPAGNIEHQALHFRMTRSWGLRDYSFRISTIDISGEVLYAAASDGPARLAVQYRERWAQIEEMCRSVQALMVFLNILRIKEVHDSGELKLLLDTILKSDRRPRCVVFVITGIDVFEDQQRVERERQGIEKKYELAFEMLDHKGIDHTIVMVSSLGPGMTRKKPADQLPDECQNHPDGPEHICPKCQELVSDPGASPRPINLSAPWEYIFRHLLPWNCRHPVAANVTHVVGAVLKVVLNPVVAILILLGVGAGVVQGYRAGEGRGHDQVLALARQWDTAATAEGLRQNAADLEEKARDYLDHYAWVRRADFEAFSRPLGLTAARLQEVEGATKACREFVQIHQAVNDRSRAASDRYSIATDYARRLAGSQTAEIIGAYEPALYVEKTREQVAAAGDLLSRLAVMRKSLARADLPPAEKTALREDAQKLFVEVDRRLRMQQPPDVRSQQPGWWGERMDEWNLFKDELAQWPLSVKGRQELSTRVIDLIMDLEVYKKCAEVLALPHQSSGDLALRIRALQSFQLAHASHELAALAHEMQESDERARAGKYAEEEFTKLPDVSYAADQKTIAQMTADRAQLSAFLARVANSEFHPRVDGMIRQLDLTISERTQWDALQARLKSVARPADREATCAAVKAFLVAFPKTAFLAAAVRERDHGICNWKVDRVVLHFNRIEPSTVRAGKLTITLLTQQKGSGDWIEAYREVVEIANKKPMAMPGNIEFLWDPNTAVRLKVALGNNMNGGTLAVSATKDIMEDAPRVLLQPLNLNGVILEFVVEITPAA